MPILHLSPEDHVRVTVAAELEVAGYEKASLWVRSTVKALKGLKWPVEIAVRRIPPQDVLRVHHGSNPPSVQPIMVPPSMRPDQITS